MSMKTRLIRLFNLIPLVCIITGTAGYFLMKYGESVKDFDYGFGGFFLMAMSFYPFGLIEFAFRMSHLEDLQRADKKKLKPNN